MSRDLEKEPLIRQNLLNREDILTRTITALQDIMDAPYGLAEIEDAVLRCFENIEFLSDSDTINRCSAIFAESGFRLNDTHNVVETILGDDTNIRRDICERVLNLVNIAFESSVGSCRS